MWNEIKKALGFETPKEGIRSDDPNAPEHQLRNFRMSGSGLGYIHADIYHVRTNTYIGIASGKTEEEMKADAQHAIERERTRREWATKTVDL